MSFAGMCSWLGSVLTWCFSFHQIHSRYEGKKTSKHKRNLAITGGVTLSVIASPVIAAVSVGKWHSPFPFWWASSHRDRWVAQPWEVGGSPKGDLQTAALCSSGHVPACHIPLACPRVLDLSWTPAARAAARSGVPRHIELSLTHPLVWWLMPCGFSWGCLCSWGSLVLHCSSTNEGLLHRLSRVN